MIDTSLNPNKHLGVAAPDLRYLIVNADDFGLSAGVNEGILECFTRGLVTSASLMVRGGAAQEAGAISRSHPGLGIGLHLDLGEWKCVAGSWSSVYEVVPTDDAIAVEHELWRQLTAFRELLDCDPTHIDSHQHIHRHAPARAVVQRMGKELGVPVRHFSSRIRYCGSFYGQTGNGDSLIDGVSVAHLIQLITNLPSGVTEIGCHPGYGDDLDTMYRVERRQEIETLCCEAVRRAIVEQGTKLISYAEINKVVSKL